MKLLVIYHNDRTILRAVQTTGMNTGYIIPVPDRSGYVLISVKVRIFRISLK